MAKELLCLDAKEVIVVKKLLEHEMREFARLYEDEQALSERIAKYLNELEADF